MFIPINFSNIEHKKAIIKLATRNNFYVDDIKINIGMPSEFSLMLAQIAKNYSFDEDIFDNKKNSGYFYIEQKEGIKKIVGFIILEVSTMTFRFIEDTIKDTIERPYIVIHYLLVDKEYRDKGIGQSLVRHHHKTCRENNIHISVVKEASNQSLGFWRKQHYFEDIYYEGKVFNNHTRMISLLTNNKIRTTSIPP